MPFLGTSALVAAVTLVSLTLVILIALGPGPVRSTLRSHAAPSGEPRPPVGFLHPQAVAPTTTSPSAPAAAVTPSPTLVSSQAAAPTTPSPPPVHPPAPPQPAPVPSHGIVPPANPSSNVAESPNFAAICRQDGNGSAPCVSAATQATAGARAVEGLGPMALPSNFAALSAGEQLFVLTDIERVDRGLPPVVGMVSQLTQDAQSAADGNTDPGPSSVPPGITVMAWASNWAEAAGPLGSNYNWMYNDGPGSGNLGCTSSNPGACWGHRDNELGFNAAKVAASHGVLVMGAAESAVPADAPWSSDAELIALVAGSPTYTYTWAQAQAPARAEVGQDIGRSAVRLPAKCGRDGAAVPSPIAPGASVDPANVTWSRNDRRSRPSRAARPSRASRSPRAPERPSSRRPVRS